MMIDTRTPLTLPPPRSPSPPSRHRGRPPSLLLLRSSIVVNSTAKQRATSDLALAVRECQSALWPTCAHFERFCSVLLCCVISMQPSPGVKCSSTFSRRPHCTSRLLRCASTIYRSGSQLIGGGTVWVPQHMLYWKMWLHCNMHSTFKKAAEKKIRESRGLQFYARAIKSLKRSIGLAS